MNQTIQIARITFLALLLTAAFCVSCALAQAQSSAKTHGETKSQAKTSSKTPAAATSQSSAQVQMLSAHAPLVFEPNRGQAPSNVQWLAHGSRFIIALTSDGAVLEFRDEGNPSVTPRVLQLLTAPSQPTPKRLARSAAPRQVKSGLVKLHLSGSRAWKPDGVSP
ncbi:MAG TPA: hypothetical protein VK473_09085, partial [Terriglobales bacterium]|nr:hypothetical protein [Terriglobales bacterium]